MWSNPTSRAVSITSGVVSSECPAEPNAIEGIFVPSLRVKLDQGMLKDSVESLCVVDPHTPSAESANETGQTQIANWPFHSSYGMNGTLRHSMSVFARSI